MLFRSQTTFYYCIKQADYSSENSAIGSESCSEPIHHLDYNKILENYFSGPNSSELLSPFPAGTKLVSFTLDQQTAHIVLSDHFAELSGVDLTVACACLSITVENMTNCATVTISAEKKLLDNQESITIDTKSLLLTDHVHP